MEMTIGQGRGSNPNSKKNLRRPDCKYFVFDNENGNAKISGPHTSGVAYRKAQELNMAAGKSCRYFSWTE
jgi:hypothetical protein